MNLHKRQTQFVLLVCSVLALLLACGCALAAEGVLAQENRTVCMTVDGLQFAKDPVYEDGVWTMTIDAAATDWQNVIAEGYNASQEIGGVSFLIKSDPDKLAKRTYLSSANYLTPQEQEEWLAVMQNQRPMAPAPGSGLASVSKGLSIGDFDAASGTFFPRETPPEEKRIIFARFEYQDGTFDSCYIMAEIAFTSLNPVKVNLPKVAAENIIPNFGSTTLAAKTSNGKVEYSNPTDQPREIVVLTGVKAPGTAQETADWKAYVGGDQKAMAKDENGHTVVCLETELPAEAAACSDAYVIVWKNAEGKVAACQLITVKTLQGNPRPWPEYVEELEPFAKSDVKLKTLGGVDGVSVTAKMDESMVHLAIDSKKVISAAAKGQNLLDAKLEVSLKVPKNAAYYTGGNTVSAGDNIYGPDMAEIYTSANGGLTDTPVSVSGPRLTLNPMLYFQEKVFPASNGGNIQYYLAENRSFATELGGAVQIITWYDEQKNPLGKNYLIFTFDDAPLVTLQQVLESEEDLTASVEEPRVVIEGNWHKGHGEVALKAERMPSSPQSHYYHLQLVGEDGQVIPVPAGEKCIVYLPYPEGYTRETAQDLVLTIGHYNSQMELQEEVFSVEAGNLELTPFGMRLRVSGFSPFVVNWVEEEEPEVTAVNVETLSNEHLSAELKKAGFQTAADVDIAIRMELLNKGINVSNAVLYDVQLVCLENGKWVPADKEHFPLNDQGKPWLQVQMDLPKGSTPSCLFKVAHMFSTSDFGNVPGTIEYPAVDIAYVNGTPKLSFYVTGLSPVMVTWEQPASVPATGDSTPVALLMVLLAVSALGLILHSKRRSA